MIAAISIMAALLYAPWQGKRKTFGPWFDLLDQAVQELFFLHVLLFIYNGSWAGCKSSCTSSLWLRAFATLRSLFDKHRVAVSHVLCSLTSLGATESIK